MITSKKELKNYLRIEKDFYKPTFGGFILSLFGLSEKNIIHRYQKYLRKWEYHSNTNHKYRALKYKAKTELIGNKYGMHISINNFEEGLKIMHLGSILVNSNTRVGKYCSIHTGTALVATNGTTESPKLGDFCSIGVNAVIVGGVTLKNHVVVGAGAVVTKSFEEDTITLGGVPAKIISHKGIM